MGRYHGIREVTVHTDGRGREFTRLHVRASRETRKNLADIARLAPSGSDGESVGRAVAYYAAALRKAKGGGGE